MANLWDNWKQHAEASHIMKGQSVKDYHQKSGHNFDLNFPGLAPGGVHTPTSFIGPTLGTGYQLAQEGLRSILPEGKNFLGVTGTNIGFIDAMKSGLEQAKLNTLGMTKQGFNVDEYNEFANRFGLAIDQKGHRAQQFKQQQLMNRRKQDMQQRIREAEAAAKAKAEKKRIEQEKIKTAQKNWKPTYNPASSHAEAQATGGDYHSGHESTVGGQTTDWGPSSHMIARGGLAQHAPRYANGGLIDFFRYGGFIG